MINDIIIPYIKYLWGLHWVFRAVNPLTVLYFIVGPAIIWYIKPHFSPYSRYSLIFIAFILSFVIYVLDVEYMRSLRWFEYHLCADHLDIPFEEKQEVCNSPSQSGWKNSTQPVNNHNISIGYIEYLPIVLFIFCSLFLGGVRIAWRIYHRKTIKEMGKKFRWKTFDNITIFLSLIWFATPFCVFVIIPYLFNLYPH